MEDVKHEDAENKAEDTDDLLCADVDRESGNFGLGSSFPRDHCDVLLDTIDTQLSHLQTPSRGQINRGTCRILDSLGSACLDRSNSTSKDTGLGSTILPTDKTTSTPDGSNLGCSEQSSVTWGRMGLLEEEDVIHSERYTFTSRQTEGTRVPASSRSEQCLWRLERLLGSSTELTVKADDDEEDSVRTEDFSARFHDQMVELKDGDVDVADRASSSSDTRLHNEPKTISTCDTAMDPSELSVKRPVRCLAGIPIRSFDAVTIDSDLDSVSTVIDSDLDSVSTVKVQQHLRSSMINRTVRQMFQQNGSHARKNSIRNRKQPGNQSLSSDDELFLGEMNSECVRCHRGLRSPFSIQRWEKRNRNRRSNSSTSTLTASSQMSQIDKLRTKFTDMEMPLELQNKKAAVLQVLEKLRDEVEQAERERHTLEISVTHTRAHTQLLRTELHKLQAQRDLCVKEVQALQESKAEPQRHTVACSRDASPHRSSRDSSLHRNAHRHDTSVPKCLSSSCVSVLEREEMDRLLDSTKAELFSEQRKFRHKLDSLQERLEEVSQELELKDEDTRKLKEERSQLEEKLQLAMKHKEELLKSVESEQLEQKNKLMVLKEIISQKELLVVGLQQEKSRLEMELRAAREKHNAKLNAALAQAQKEKEKEVENLRSQLRLAHEKQLHQTHEATAASLREQKLTHIRNMESLNKCIQLKEQELKKLQASLVQLQGALKRREEEMRGETQEQVKRAVEREQRKWEGQWAESAREQHERLEEKVQEVEKERRRGLQLQNQVVELQKRVEELETEASAQKDLLRTVRDEHQTEIQSLRRQLQQEAECEAERLQQCVSQAQQELQQVKEALAESEHVQQEAAVRHQQQNRSWAHNIHTECVNLHNLITHNGLMVEQTDLSHRRVSTVSEAVQELQTLGKPLQQLISTLQNHITTLTHKAQQLTSEKESELRVQREQLITEKEKALNSLKDKLIQEHVEGLSSVRRLPLRGDEDGGLVVAAGLRRRLQDKDVELRQLQSNMAVWKEKTTTRLARKLEEELERSAPRPDSELQRRVLQLEEEMRNLTGNHDTHTDVRLASSSSAALADLPNAPSSHQLASYKLLRHLQSRVRHLQAETRTHTPSSAHLSRGPEPAHLAASYLDTISSTQDSCGLRHQSHQVNLPKP